MRRKIDRIEPLIGIRVHIDIDIGRRGGKIDKG